MTAEPAEAAEPYLPAARQALAAFPVLVARLEPVAVAENITFRVTDGRNGRALVLRLHRPGYHTLAELEAERAWTAALNRAGVRAPRGLRTLDRGWYAPVATPDAAGFRYAGLTRWMDGEILSAVLEREDAAAARGRYRVLGATVGALHAQSAGWRPPRRFTRHVLDTDGLMGEAPFWGRFWESAALDGPARDLVLATRVRIRAALDRLGRDPSVFGLIHADLHPGNVLITRGRLGVIDFDDAAFGWLAYDMAVALFQASASPDFVDIRRAFLEGYASIWSVDGRVEALLEMFLLVRGLALLGWLLQRPELDPAPFHAARLGDILARCEAFESPC